MINTCSIQHPFQDLAAEICPSAVSVGINPMFSPKLDCAGRPVVVCEDSRTQAGEMLSSLLRLAGMDVTWMTAQEHDRAMSVCQVLPHAAILTFLLSLPKSRDELKSILTIAPPPMQVLMCLAARIMDNEPIAYWDIQKHNDYAGVCRWQMDDILTKLSGWISADNSQQFCTELLTSTNELGDLVDIHANKCCLIFDVLNNKEHL